MPTRDSVFVDVIAETKSALANMATFAAGIGTAIVAVKKIADEIKKSIDAYLVQEKAVTKLNAALKATGNIVGISSGEMQQAAVELSRLSGIADETVINAQALLVTFTQVGRDAFPRAIEAAADMSAMFGQDLQQSVIQLGTALNDPIAGVGRLRRIGISFTQDQKDSIAAFMQQNDIMAAQGVILDELNNEFGGVAKMVGETNVGAMNKLKNAYVDLQEEMGKTAMQGLRPLVDWMTRLLNAAVETRTQINLLHEVLSGQRAKDLGEMNKQLGALYIEYSKLSKQAPQVGAAIQLNTFARKELQKTIMSNIEALEAEIEIETIRQAKLLAMIKGEKDNLEQEEIAANAKVEFLAKLKEAYAETDIGTQEALQSELDYWEKGVLPFLAEGERMAQVLAIIVKLKAEIARYEPPIPSAKEKPKEEPGGFDEEHLDLLIRITNQQADYNEKVRDGFEAYQEGVEAAKESAGELNESWIPLQETLKSIAADQLVALGEAFGAALATGEDAAKALAEAGKDAIAMILEALAKEFAVRAIAALAKAIENPAELAAFVGFTAAATAAAAAAGAVRALATGGIVTKPTMALIAETGPEAVIPLNRAGGMGTTIIYNIRGSYIAEREMARQVIRGQQRELRGH